MNEDRVIFIDGYLKFSLVLFSYQMKIKIVSSDKKTLVCR